MGSRSHADAQPLYLYLSRLLAAHHIRVIMPGLTVFPPWPEDVPTHPLLVVDFQRVKAGDEAEIDTLWKAATELGFW